MAEEGKESEGPSALVVGLEPGMKGKRLQALFDRIMALSGVQTIVLYSGNMNEHEREAVQEMEKEKLLKRVRAALWQDGYLSVDEE